VSGEVRLGSTSGPGIPGVLVTGVSGTTTLTGTTDSNGHYILGGCGVPGLVLTPTLSGYTFTPASQSYTGTSLIFVGNLNGTPTATPPSIADLAISSVVTAPQGWSGGCALNLVMGVRVIVRNNGTANAGSFIVDVSGTQQTVSSLAAGASVTLWFARTGNLTVVVDINNTVPENNESNNAMNYTTITATPPVVCTRTPTPTGSVTTVITNTPTRTNTPGITNTPTRTPTITLTPTRTSTSAVTLTPTATIGTSQCSPVTSTITIPFTFDGAGTFCWQASSLGGFINSWNTVSVNVNGVNVTNVWVGSGSYPAKINGFYYVGYNSSVAWGHFEAK
jgi:hypothetical protein